MKAPLRVGLLVNGLVQPRWIQKLVADIRASPVAEIVLVVVNATPVPHRSLAQKLWQDRRELLYRLYRKLDEALFRQRPDAFEPVSIADLLDCPQLEVKPRQRRYSDYFEEADIQAIRAYELDVALRFGFRILRGEALRLARYGVWSYHHGDNLVNRGGPPGFWEVMHATPLTGSVLQILSEDLDSGQVIYRSQASTHPYSVTKNKHNYYWKSSAFALRKLAELHAEGRSALEREACPPTYQPYSHRLYQAPGNAEMLRLLARLIDRYAMHKLNRLLYREQWFLAYHVGGAAQPADNFYRFKQLQPPDDRDWADPCVVKRGDSFFIFVEEYVYRKRKGHIAVIQIDAQGRWQPAVPVLERDYHLSYPCVFQWQGRDYMIPETAAKRTVELYQCTSFPGGWALCATLLRDVRATDATVAEVDGRWWMFANIAVAGASNNDELHLFYADSPLGPWVPHRRNPVKSDVQSARPAGRLFHLNGQLCRPAQDCSQRYGYAITIHQIHRLDPEEFRESAIARILPRWTAGLVATHTLNSGDGFTVIDGQRRRRRIA